MGRDDDCNKIGSLQPSTQSHLMNMQPTALKPLSQIQMKPVLWYHLISWGSRWGRRRWYEIQTEKWELVRDRGCQGGAEREREGKKEERRVREGQREWAREGAEERQGSLLWKTVLGRLNLPIGDMKTPSPALCIVMGAGWGYRNGLDTECPDSVGFTIWWEVRHQESHHINNTCNCK